MSKNWVDLMPKSSPSEPPILADHGLATLVSLGFYRSEFLVNNFECVHFPTSWEGLSRLPEVYEQLAPRPSVGLKICLLRNCESFVLDNGKRNSNCEMEGTSETSSAEEENNTKPATSPAQTENCREQTLEDILTVTVPDKKSTLSLLWYPGTR